VRLRAGERRPHSSVPAVCPQQPWKRSPKTQSAVHSPYAAFGGREGLLQAVYDRYIPVLDTETPLSVPQTPSNPDGTWHLLLAGHPLPAGAAGPGCRAGRDLGPSRRIRRGVLIEHGALRIIAVLGRWLDGEVAAGCIRDLPRGVAQFSSRSAQFRSMRSRGQDSSTFCKSPCPMCRRRPRFFAEVFVRAVATTDQTSVKIMVRMG
jgi:hypothetical protein